MARVNPLSLFPSLHPAPGLRLFKVNARGVLRTKTQHIFKVKPKQRVAVRNFNYAIWYWKNLLTSAVKADWNARAAGLYFTRFNYTALPMTGYLQYKRCLNIGLYNGRFTNGNVDVPNPKPYTTNSLATGYYCVGNTIVTENHIVNQSDASDVCFCFVSFPINNSTIVNGVPAVDIGMQALQQNAVADGFGGWFYTQYWLDPFYKYRPVGSALNIWWLWYNLNWPMGLQLLTTTKV